MLPFLKHPLSTFGMICFFSIVLLLPKASTSIFPLAKTDNTFLSEDSCKGRDLAVFFAVKDYQHLSKLKNPIRDATKIAAALYDEYNFDTLILRNPTRADILSWVDKHLSSKEYEEYEQLLLFFSGHGRYEEIPGVGYFQPVEAQDANLVKDSFSLSFPELSAKIDSIKNKHILVMIDACYSGAFFKYRAEDTRPQPVRNRCDFIRDFFQSSSRQGISSTGLVRVSDGTYNSPFTIALLNILASKGNEDKILTIYELMADLEKIKSKPQLGFFGQNDPESSFLFVHKDSTWEWGKMLSSTLYIQDYRDFQTYKQFEFIDQGDTITWISDNINYDGVNSWQYKNKGWYSEKFGRLYRWEEAQKVCPSGWKLPSVEDWEKLAQVHGGYQDQFSSSKNGSPEKAYRLLTKTGFDFFEAKLGGVRLTDGGFQDMDKKGFYWTSTPVEGDSSKAFAFMFSKRRNGKVVNILKDAVPKANAFSCRCVKE